MLSIRSAQWSNKDT